MSLINTHEEAATEGRTNMEEADPRILQVIENSVAASRWRIAARFEGPQTAAQYRRHAERRRAAATAILNEIATKTGREGQPPTGLRHARDDAGGLGPRRAQTEE